MNVKSCEKKEKSTCGLVVEITPEEFDAAIEQVYRRNRSKISVPGFRKGKAPRKIVENMYGKAELSNMIREAVNDDKLVPSEAHLRLLALPWKDVYTTNYDTLLERTALRLNEQGRRLYSVIRYDEAIGMETPPFLMKLHGDINEPQSIIISEEDYRTYSSKHQAMINHIQHAIMLETMVLIGFSGNDPNFLQWLGWVRDALKNNQRKVYLLSVDGVPDAVKKSFEKKNVIVVDLKGLAGKDAAPPENVLGAISFLEGFIYQKEQERAQYRNTALIWGRTSNRDENIEQQFARWKQERETYPGWLVMPREKRENWASIEGFSLSIDKIKQLSKDDQLLYLDLFNWRIEIKRSKIYIFKINHEQKITHVRFNKFSCFAIVIFF